MSYHPNGELTTDSREIASSEEWSSQSDWDAYQSSNNVVIENGTVSLDESPFADIVDNFEDDPNGPYDTESLSDFYQGDVSYFGRSTDQSNDGSQSLEITESGPGFMYSLPGDGLPTYPDPEDTIEYDAYDTSSGGGAYASLRFSVVDSNNAFGVTIAVRDDMLEIRKIEGDSPTTLTTSSPSLDTQTWYRGEIERSWSGNDCSITFTVYDASDDSEVDSISTTETFAAVSDARGIGFVDRADQTSAWDNVR